MILYKKPLKAQHSIETTARQDNTHMAAPIYKYDVHDRWVPERYKYNRKPAGDIVVDILSEIFDAPQKAATYALTTLTRGPGKGRYVTPSRIIDGDWGVTNPYIGATADILLDPLNMLPIGMLAHAKQAKTAKNVIHITSPTALKKYNKVRKAVSSTDNLLDLNGAYSMIDANGRVIQNLSTVMK